MLFREITSKFAGGHGDPPLQRVVEKPTSTSVSLSRFQEMRENLYNLPPSRALRVPPPSKREEYEDCGYAANLNLNKNFQKKQGHFPNTENALSFCLYNLFCCTSGADCASTPNARHSAREIADNPIPVRVCGFAENRRADCDGLQYGSVRGGNPIQIPVRRAEDQGVAVQNRCAFHRLCLADIRRGAHQRIADGRFPQNFMCGKSAKATKSARAFAVFFLKYLLKSTPFQWYNNR